MDRIKKKLERVLADVAAKNINEIVYGGDIGSSSAHEYFFKALKNYSLNLILGNHDKYGEINKYL
jgi:metallophosphoesterase superfamily enzyme